MRNARTRGTKRGRKVIPVATVEVKRLRAEGKSFRSISQELGISVGVIHKSSQRKGLV